MRKGRITAGAVVAIMLAVLGAIAALQAAPATATPSGKVTLCHLADGPAQAGLITVAAAAAYNGHYLQHSADIIPPFEYQGQTYSLNWTGSFPEECTGEGGTTTEPPTEYTQVKVCDPASGHIIRVNEQDADQYLPVGNEACGEDPVIPPEDPPVAGINCPVGEHPWHGKCYEDDSQKQPDGSVIYGEQG